MQKIEKKFMKMNYLGHSFNSRNITSLPNDFICKTCGVKVYLKYPANNVYSYGGSSIKYDLTCQEQQIKNLLE